MVKLLLLLNIPSMLLYLVYLLRINIYPKKITSLFFSFI